MAARHFRVDPRRHVGVRHPRSQQRTGHMWIKGGMLAALYGGYLFGYFTLRGQLPGVLAGQHGAQHRGTGDG